MRVTIAEFHNKADNLPKTRVLTWAQLVNKMSTHQERPTKDGPLFSPVRYRPQTKRANANVQSIVLAVGEWDGSEPYVEVAQRLRAAGYAFAAYSTYSNTPEREHFRVVIPLTQEVQASDWRGGARIWARISKHIFGGTNEPHDGDEARMYYWPACLPAALRFVDHSDGRALDAYSLPEAPAEPVVTLSGNGHRQPEPGELSGLPVGRMALKFIALGAPLGEQRKAACAAARNLKEAGWSVDRIADALWRGFQASHQDHNNPWTCDHARQIAEDIDEKPAPPVKPLDDAIGQVPPDQQTQTGAASAPNVAPSLQPTRLPPPYALTDLGNGERFAEAHGERFRYVDQWGWLTDDGRHWARDITGERFRAAKAVARTIYDEAAKCPDADRRKQIAAWARLSESQVRIDAMLSVARWEAPITARVEQFDSDNHLLNVANGVVDLRTGDLRPHNPADMITKLAPVAYDPNATAPLFNRFLARIIPISAVRDYLRRWAGYSATGSTREERLSIWHGSGRNGKTTLAITIQNVLGDYAKQVDPEMLMEHRNQQHPTGKASLHGVRAAFAVETNEGSRLATSTVKALVSNDKISARFVCKDYFDFIPTHSLALLTNHKPEIRTTDEGTWRKIDLVPFTITIPEQEKDLELPEKLKAEATGILAWIVQGAGEWYCSGLPRVAEIMAATAEYREESDVLADFLAERCIIAPAASVPVGVLYATYVEWCAKERQLGKNQFGGRLKERGFGQAKSGARRWLGLDVVGPNTPAPQVDEGGVGHWDISGHEILYERANMFSHEAYTGNSVQDCPIVQTPEAITGDTSTACSPGPKYDICQWVNAVSADGVLQTSKPVQILDIYESANGTYFYALPGTNTGWPEQQIEPAEAPMKPAGEPEQEADGWPITLQI
ncbi:MAG: DNA primase family protein [Chloroflexota bacterium]